MSGTHRINSHEARRTDALRERQLMMLEHSAEGHRRAQVTDEGKSFLDALHPEELSRQTAA
ncbi:hypothetical protein [Caballeronia catudaia]|uniref:hypothetical protein n=1 Tax=Caballeronia catudaia TaxID=1777136 RepID=UPI000AF23702